MPNSLPTRLPRYGDGEGVYSVYLVYLVYSVYSVCLVYLVCLVDLGLKDSTDYQSIRKGVLGSDSWRISSTGSFRPLPA